MIVQHPENGIGGAGSGEEGGRENEGTREDLSGVILTAEFPPDRVMIPNDLVDDLSE